MGDTSFSDWKSLYSNEIENAWKSETTEFRKIAMLLRALKLEFDKTEAQVNNRMSQLKRKINLADSKQVDLGNESDNPLHESPKLKKNLKKTRLKHLSTSPSLLNISTEKRKESLAAVKIHSKKLFSPFLESSPEPENKPKEPKVKSNVDVIDSSIMNQTPCKNVQQKKLTTNSKTIKSVCTDETFLPGYLTTETKKSVTSTNNQLQVPDLNTKKRKLNILSVLNTKTNPSSNCDNQMSSDDETIVTSQPSKKDTKENHSRLVQMHIPTLNFFKDYDKIPKPKSKSPQYVHKTEPVRRKTDKLKLPGWACSDCEKFYKGMNLPPEELQQKMNACSKHRSKYPALDDTPKGFWDITIQLTPEEDSNVFKF